MEDGVESGEQSATGKLRAATRKFRRGPTNGTVGVARAGDGADEPPSLSFFRARLLVPRLGSVLLPTAAAPRGAPRNACPHREMRATAADLVGTAGTDASSSNSMGSRHIIVLLEAELRDELLDPLLKRRDVADIGSENGLVDEWNGFASDHHIAAHDANREDLRFRGAVRQRCGEGVAAELET